jgi:tetratricopeptide (TPR) repeat protein
MRSVHQIAVSTLALLALGSPQVFGSGGGSMRGPSVGSMDSSPPRSPEQLAAGSYNAGVRYVNKAKEYDSDAAKAAGDDKKKAKALEKAAKTYASALEQFEKATEEDPGLYQAWNYVGFCQRHLGDYEAALKAYSTALELNPSYGEAVEYRAEAYLGLNRIEDAKSAYMSLFRDVRPLAAELMTAMRHWLDERQNDPKGVAGEELASFAKWIDERAAIAQQTASLSTGTATRSLGDWR